MTAPSTPTPIGPELAARTRRLAKRDAWQRRGPLLPALIFVIIVTQLPFIATLVFSFMNWDTDQPQNTGFAGFGNFKKVLTDEDLLEPVWNTILLTVSVVLVSLLLGLGIALLLNRKFMGRGLVRTMIIAPFLIVPVAAALFFKHGLYNPIYGAINGVVTWFFSIFGDANPPQFDIISNTPFLAIQIQLIWQWTPFMTLILLAGLQSRPPEILEAAAVDGATGWQIFRNMTMPHMRRYLELAGLLGSIYIIQNFDATFTITSGGLGTANLPYTIYETFYRAHDNGLASAQGVIVVIGTIIIATFALRTVSSLFEEGQ